LRFPLCVFRGAEDYIRDRLRQCVNDPWNNDPRPFEAIELPTDEATSGQHGMAILSGLELWPQARLSNSVSDERCPRRSCPLLQASKSRVTSASPRR
jgi:hypothetical protein